MTREMEEDRETNEETDVQIHIQLNPEIADPRVTEIR